MFFEKGLLNLRNHQDFGPAFRREYGMLMGGEMAVAPGEPVQRIAQGARLFLVAGVGREVDVQPRHLVEPDHPVGRTPDKIARYPLAEAGVAAHVAERGHRHDDEFESVRNFAFPFERVHADRVAARLAGQRDAQEIPLQSAEGEILVKAEGQLHQSLSGGASTPRGRL